MLFQPNFPQLDLQNTGGHSKHTGSQLGKYQGEGRADKDSGLNQLHLNILLSKLYRRCGHVNIRSGPYPGSWKELRQMRDPKA